MIIFVDCHHHWGVSVFFVFSWFTVEAMRSLIGQAEDYLAACWGTCTHRRNSKKTRKIRRKVVLLLLLLQVCKASGMRRAGGVL